MISAVALPQAVQALHRGGGRLTGKKNQGRSGGNLDAGDIGKLSSVPKGTVGASRKAQDRNRADRTGVSLKRAKAMGSAQRSAATRANKKSPTAMTKVNFRAGRVFR